jgi:hypothetical protein
MVCLNYLILIFIINHKYYLRFFTPNLQQNFPFINIIDLNFPLFQLQNLYRNKNSTLFKAILFELLL